MREVKCECGHVNPHGTVLCESCGRVLDEKQRDEQMVDMRYEGTARRSQTYNQTVIDKVWSFFSSVKVGVWLIVITLAASAIGTILPQEQYIPPLVDPAEHYGDEYGIIGTIYYTLGFHNLYSSWWYLILVASIGISLVICSLDRVIPLYRALKTQRIDRHPQFLARQRIYGETDLEGSKFDLEEMKHRLKSRKYKVREENGSILAEKNRFSRWGPYVNHIGLIIFLIGGMFRFVPDMYVDERLWLREGETKPIPETEGRYYLKNEQFIVDVYDKEKEKDVFSEAIERNGTVVKNFQTDAVLYEADEDRLPGEEPELKKVREQAIRVNEPLKAGGLTLYQTDYKLNEFKTMYFTLINKETEQEYGEIKIDLNNPKSEYQLDNGYSVQIIKYLPDFIVGEDGEPDTQSRVPNNPAFVFKLISPEKPKGEISFVAVQKTIESSDDNIYKMAFANVETQNATFLTVRRDYTLPILGLGGFIFMIGVVQGAYWQHRRIWVRVQDDKVLIAAHTNKNWYGLKTDLSKALQGLGLDEPEDRAERKGKTS